MGAQPTLSPGDTLVKVDRDRGRYRIYATAEVERITPTGIIVLDNGARLTKPESDGGYEVRGEKRSTWRMPARYYPQGHQIIGEARDYLELERSRVAVITAYEKWLTRKDDADLLDTLATAATTHATNLRAPQENR